MVVILYFGQFSTSALKIWLSAGFASRRRLSNPIFDRDDWWKSRPMRLTIRPIDRAAQGLSKTPLIIVIGRLGEE
eukprot:scaffold1895_cov77-Skeletonema_marinoi.AAC.1